MAKQKQYFIDLIKQTQAELNKGPVKDFNQQMIKDVLKAFNQVVYKNLQKGNQVVICELGSMSVGTSKAMVKSNPRTGEKVNVPSKKRIKFQTSATLKRAINTK